MYKADLLVNAVDWSGRTDLLWYYVHSTKGQGSSAGNHLSTTTVPKTITLSKQFCSRTNRCKYKRTLNTGSVPQNVPSVVEDFLNQLVTATPALLFSFHFATNIQ